MNDSLLVGRTEALGDLDGIFHGLAHGERTLCEPVPQRLALEQLRYGVGDSIRGAKVEDGENRRVRKRGDGLGLALKAGESDWVVGQTRGKHLDRHVAGELRVPCAIDLAHSARADRRDDLVGPEPNTRTQCHRRGSYLASCAASDLRDGTTNRHLPNLEGRRCLRRRWHR